MRPELIVLCPTRGRPKAAHAVWESFMDTRTDDRVRLHFALDEDDPTYDKYPPGKAKYPSRGPVQALNLAFARHVVTENAKYVGTICDEQRFITVGWDRRILDALDEQGGGMVFPNDLINPGTMPAAPFMSVSMLRAVGYLAYPLCTTNYYDNVWKDLAEGVGKLKYLDDVIVQHLSMPHAKDDSRAIARDRQRYYEWVEDHRAADVAAAKAALA